MLAALWVSRVNLAVVYYGFKGCSLYARRGEPGDEARVNPLSNKLNIVYTCMTTILFGDNAVSYRNVSSRCVPAPLTL